MWTVIQKINQDKGKLQKSFKFTTCRGQLQSRREEQDP